MSLDFSANTKSVTDLKRHTHEILEHVRKTKCPMLLTLEGKAAAVLVDAKTYQRQVKAMNLAHLLAEGEEDISAGRVRSARSFLREFKNAHKIPS